jgi:putative protease
MTCPSKKIELLAPAGNFEKLETAIHYGADAVYLGGRDFSLRNFSGNFTLEEMADAVAFAHQKSVKAYVTCNIYPRTWEAKAIADFMTALEKIGPDAIIIADPGVLSMARRIIPDIPIHLSTQANTTSREALLFWAAQGVTRINTARELSLSEIQEMVDGAPVEIEAFVHGAMCISYSGRCLLSSFMAQRDANRGLCAQPCRWRYAVVEELRPGLYMPLAEDDRGSYIFNSRDLCMIDHIPEIVGSGITSLKIEGRMKGLHYLAVAVRTYRQAIDSYYTAPNAYAVSDDWRKALSGITQRGFCTGFYSGDPNQQLPDYQQNPPDDTPKFVGKIMKKTGERLLIVGVRNKIHVDDAIDILTASGPAEPNRIVGILSEAGEAMPVAQPNDTVTIEIQRPSNCTEGDMIQRYGN